VTPMRPMTPGEPDGTAVPSRDATVAMAAAVLRRPDLWWSALGALRRLAVPGWWRSRPYVPRPDRRLWGFRMLTAYGSVVADPEPEDVISYLEWCRSTSRPRPILSRTRPAKGPPNRLELPGSG
jgi:hypothetical protein